MRTGYLVLFILALILLLAWQFPYAVASTDQKMRIVYMIALLILIGGGSMTLSRTGFSQNMKYGAIWIGIILVLVFAYSFRDDIGFRMMGELMPGRVQMSSSGELTLRSGENGHFHLVAEVNGAPIRFMIDTGASDIVLSPQDAERAGFDPATLNYTRTYSTANGVVKGAPVKLNTLSVGPITMHDLPASVNGADMGGSLLGMTFLQQFQSYNVSGNTLTLKP